MKLVPAQMQMIFFPLFFYQCTDVRRPLELDRQSGIDGKHMNDGVVVVFPGGVSPGSFPSLVAVIGQDEGGQIEGRPLEAGLLQHAHALKQDGGRLQGEEIWRAK